VPQRRFSRGLIRALLVLTCAAGPASGRGAQSIQDPLSGKQDPRQVAVPSPQPPAPAEKRIRLLEAWRVPLASPLSGPLLPLGDRVVASAENGAVQAFSPAEGRLLWKAELGEKAAGGPVEIAGQVVQATASGKVVALDAAAGTTLWTTALQQDVQRQIAAASDGILVPLAAGQVVFLDARGQERWRVDLRGAPSTPATVCRDMVMVGTEAGTVEAFDRRSGRRLWLSRVGSPVRSPLLCFDGAVYLGTDDDRLRALKTSGRKRWSYKVGGLIRATPLAVGRRVYFLSYDNYVYVVKAGSGNLIQRVRMSHRLSDDALQDPARLYLSPYTSARLTVLTLPELQQIGEYRLDLDGEWFTTPPVRVGERVLIGYGRYEGRILALKEEAERAPAAAASTP
jgi:outer membrane protein assembly factor BamB